MHVRNNYFIDTYKEKIFLPTLLEGLKVKHRLNIRQCFYVEPSVLRA